MSVYVDDINEAPTFPSRQTTRSVAENTGSGQDVGAPVEASDVDDGDSLTYELGGDDASAFEHQLVYRSDPDLRSDIDYETDDEYTVTVTARDYVKRD